MSTSTLTKEERIVINILEKMGALAISQVMDLLMNQFSCTEKQAEYVLRYLNRINYITVNNDSGIVAIGNNTKDISRAVIEAFYICMEMASDTDSLKFAHRDTVSGAELSFVSNGRLYEVVHLTNDSLSKINYFQNLYYKNKQAIDRDQNSAGLEYIHTTIYMFSPGINEDVMLAKIDSLNITMPHILVFLKNNDLNGHQEMHIYDALADGEKELS